MNIPVSGDKVYSGMQHKYGETVLFFPSQGQSCHGGIIIFKAGVLKKSPNDVAAIDVFLRLLCFS